MALSISGSTSKQQSCLVFTPYDLSPGGGEKYLLEFILTMQEAGYAIELLTMTSNHCKDHECVSRTAGLLRVPVRVNEIRLTFVELLDLDAFLYIKRPEVYFELGNKKIPFNPNPGGFGIYMCQFPFDLDADIADTDLRKLSTFDAVFVNSAFTQSWYHELVYRAHAKMERLKLIWPNVVVVHPAVENIQLSTDGNVSEPRKPCAVLLGRIFGGTQNKGHMEAVAATIQIAKQVPDFELHIIGQQQPGHFEYFQKLQYAARMAGHIQFHVNASNEVLSNVSRKCYVQWHLTGIRASLDPSNFEHFGISIVEGMLAGMTPIVVKIGGGAEIVKSGLGSLVSSVGELVDSTVVVLKGMGSGQSHSSAAAKLRAREFSRNAFQARVRQMVDDVSAPANFGKLKYTWCEVLQYASLCSEANGSIVTFIDHPVVNLRALILKAIAGMPQGWRFYIYHKPRLSPFLRYALREDLGKLELREVKLDSVRSLYQSMWHELGAAGQVLVVEFEPIFTRHDQIECPAVHASMLLPLHSAQCNAITAHTEGSFCFNKLDVDDVRGQGCAQRPFETNSPNLSTGMCAVYVPQCRRSRYISGWFLDSEHGGPPNEISLEQCVARNWGAFCTTKEALYKVLRAPPSV
jgi:glycosyltransferase involved in cell wall biosynthesis